MHKPTVTFDNLPQFVYELVCKVDHLTALVAGGQAAPTADEVGGIKLAQAITRLSAARIYALVSERKIPHKKRGNRLSFRRSELLAWLDEGNREMKGEVTA